MTFYTPTVGIITNIDYQSGSSFSSGGCSVLFSVQSEDQGQIQVSLPANAYVLNLHQFRIGDRATFFYSTNAPMPLIYPPRYQAVAAAYTPPGTTAALDVFNEMLTNTDGTLTLTPTWNTPVTLPNGQAYANDPGGHLLLATYSATTRSIPAQAIPEQVVVFCPGT